MRLELKTSSANSNDSHALLRICTLILHCRAQFLHAKAIADGDILFQEARILGRAGKIHKIGIVSHYTMSIVGLDLAGVETRPTGLCILEDMKAKTLLVFSDEEIVSKTKEVNPRVVAVDAPLSLPPGRKSIEERTGTHLRKCDEELLRRRIKFFPITLGPMRKLTSRGIKLKGTLESADLTVIEVYPGGAQDVLGIPRKQEGLKKLGNGLRKLGIKGISDAMTADELDAVTCAYVGKLFLEGRAVVYGTADQAIVMPDR